jgi:hypothetical protein
MSNIDPSNPTEGQATTQSVRNNFQAAANEIDANAAAAAAAQAAADAAQADADAAQAAADAAQGKADSSVQLTGDQSIAGQKTFTTQPVSSAAQGTAAGALTRKDYVDALRMPVGMISPFAHEFSAPNWVYCNGQAISRATYAALFAAIGTNYGTGDGSTTFNVPDYRGNFLRAQDNGRGADPDAAPRSPPSNNPAGAAGDAVGSEQNDGLKSHNHAQRGRLDFSIVGGGVVPLADATNTADTGITGAAGGLETRPKNIYVRYYIYAGVA